ncbi:MAG: amidohydrolase family protein, partial [Gemmatimonadota bacterium]|nr:amidohydrolase family protein [Gemmatimonadota bacterium]
RLFGLYPRKGSISVGSDADIVLWDAGRTRTIRDEDMFSGAGFSIYSGWEVTGWPTMTIRRGEVVFADGEIRAEDGSGQLLRRSAGPDDRRREEIVQSPGRVQRTPIPSRWPRLPKRKKKP